MKRLLTLLALLSGMAFAQTSNYPVSINSFAANCIPFAVTAITLQCSALTDNATNIITTEAILGPDGAVGTPVYAFTNHATSGMYWNGSGPAIAFAGGDVVAFATGSTGNVILTPTFTIGWASSGSFSSKDTFLGRGGAAATLRVGNVNSATPVAYNLVVGESSRGGTDSNIAGASGTLKPGIGTGNAAGTQFSLVRNLMGATGTTAQSTQHAFVVCESKTLSNTTAQVQALANIALASNSAGGARGSITVTATDGTNFDSETQDFVVSYVNKATVGTVGTAAITASTAANNSGSATIGMTATFSGTTLSINATPAFTTIVPTTVTAYIELQNHGAGAVTCQ